MRGIQFQTLEDRIVVACHAPTAVEDADYAPLIRELQRVAEARGSVKLLMRTEDRGGPNVDQRAELNKVANYGNVQLAVLTDSKWCKGVAAAIRWSGAIEVKCFGTDRTDHLRQWLDLEPAHLEAVHLFVDEVSPAYNVGHLGASTSASASA